MVQPSQPFALGRAIGPLDIIVLWEHARVEKVLSIVFVLGFECIVNEKGTA
jgi:hypothetical protein